MSDKNSKPSAFAVMLRSAASAKAKSPPIKRQRVLGPKVKYVMLKESPHCISSCWRICLQADSCNGLQDSSFETCPMCGEKIAKSLMSGHVNNCIDKQPQRGNRLGLQRLD